MIRNLIKLIFIMLEAGQNTKSEWLERGEQEKSDPFNAAFENAVFGSISTYNFYTEIIMEMG